MLKRRSSFHRRALGAVVAGWLALPAGSIQAGTVSPIQALADPLGLKTAGPVQLAGSDERAKEFQANALSKLLETVKQNLPESKALPDSFFKTGIAGPDRSALTLDPAQLRLEHDADVRVYFVGEGAGYRNSLGFYTTASNAEKQPVVTDAKSLLQTNAQLMFADASSNVSFLNPTDDNSAKRTSSAPLLAGDFVDLGKMAAGTLFNPFLISDGANGNKTVYTANAAANPDRLQHFVALAVTTIGDHALLMFGIEDLKGGGDRDYNDVVFAVDIGSANVRQLAAAAVPLPVPVYALLGPFACLAWQRLRHRRIPQS